MLLRRDLADAIALAEGLWEDPRAVADAFREPFRRALLQTRDDYDDVVEVLLVIQCYRIAALRDRLADALELVDRDPILDVDVFDVDRAIDPGAIPTEDVDRFFRLLQGATPA